MKYVMLLVLVLSASVLHAGSPEGTRTPPAPYIDDGYGGIWTIGPDDAVLRNGYSAAGARGWQILLYSDSIYVLTTDGTWQRFAGSSWVDIPRDPLSSVDGTRTPPGSFINDNYGGIWTVGGGQEILRNGHRMADWQATQLLLFRNAMYASSTTGRWLRFAGSMWVDVGGDPQLVTGTPAHSAAALADSVGVTTHFNYFDTAYYQRWEHVRDLLLDSGIRHIRDGIIGMDKWYYDRINSLYKRGGVRNLTILGMWDNVDAAIAEVVDNLPGVEAIEALNEWDLNGGDDWVEDVQTYQRRFYEAMKRSPRTAHLRALGPSFTTLAAVQSVGDIGRWMDRSNLHNYYSSRHPETAGWGENGYGSLAWNVALSGTMAPRTPIWSTETGYATGPGALPDAIVARYVPRLLLSHFAAGIERTYLYQLVDAFTSVGPIDGFAMYGLVRADGTPKASYHAVKSLISLLDDGGGTFTPGSLSYVATASSQDLRQVLLQKQDGTFYLALWLEREGMEPTTYEMRPPSYDEATLSFAQAPADMTVYTLDDNGFVSERALQGGQIVSLTVGENVQLVRIPAVR